MDIEMRGDKNKLNLQIIPSDTTKWKNLPKKYGLELMIAVTIVEILNENVAHLLAKG